jgi:anti-sigma28 factor (negative regulator of flagellin synthesis)
MVINNSDIDAARLAGQTPATKLGTKLGTAAAGDPRAAGRQPGDRFQISDLATQLAGDSSSRLSRLQASIDAGTYQVSPQALAGSLIRNALIT